MGITLDGGLERPDSLPFDKRIRSGVLVALMGPYGGELFHGVVPRVLDVEDYKTLTLEDLANGIAKWTQQIRLNLGKS